MHVRFITITLGIVLVLSFFVSACSSGSANLSSVQATSVSSQQPSTRQTTSEATTSSQASPKANATIIQPKATPTIVGIPTPDNWATVNIYMTEGGVSFAPYKLYVSVNDVKGVIWANQTDRIVIVAVSDIPSSISPSTIRLAPHASQKLAIPTTAGEYAFHIQSPNAAFPTLHCVFVRQPYA